MAKISTYPVDTNISPSDKLIGTDADNSNQTKNFEIGAIASYILSQVDVLGTNVLSAGSENDQELTEADSILQVEFGPAQGTVSNPVMIDSSGNITFNVAGFYTINLSLYFSSKDTAEGTTTILFRSLVNGVQYNTAKSINLNTFDLIVAYELSIPFQAEEGDLLSFEILIDSTSVLTKGGLYPPLTSGAWGSIPSAEVEIWSIE
jgi:hypothetical protein